MSPQEQDEAIAPAPAGRRKIVLATSIAETSLTIEGVRVVVDAGLSRRARYEPVIGMTRLETVRASQAAIAQRAGRAGRTEPGVCWRLWSEGETRALAPFDPPEILESDLSGLALDLALWGVRDPSTLAWLDPPPAPAWGEARMTLWRVGAIDNTEALKARGRMLARLPLPPRLANMVVASAPEGTST
jgi:ATP-dependent helicase HrpB